MPAVVRQFDLHIALGIIVNVPQAKAFHQGRPIATLGSMTIPPVIPACCPPSPCAILCCIPNFSIGISKTYIMGMPTVVAGNPCIPCGTPAVAFQGQFNSL